MATALMNLTLGWLVATAAPALPPHVTAPTQPQLDAPEKITLRSVWALQIPKPSQMLPAWRMMVPETPVLYEGRGRACSGAEHDMAWNAQWSKLQWLRIRLGLMDSLEPQRCTVSARICVTNC